MSPKLKISLLFLALCFSLVGQNESFYTQNTANKKANRYFRKASKAKSQNQLILATSHLEAALLQEPNFIDALIALASIQYYTKKYLHASKTLEKIVDLSPEYASESRYKLAFSYWMLDDFGLVVSTLEDFLHQTKKPHNLEPKAKKMIADAQFALTAIENAVEIIPIPLEGVNSSKDEYLPAISADQTKIIFTRIVDRQEDLFECSSTGDGKWSDCSPLESLNTRYNEGAHTISPDGKVLIFTKCNQRDGMGSCDLYVSTSQLDKWSKASNLGPVINTTGWESQPSFSSDGRTLFFSSRRPGGFGGSDIWQSTLRPTGGWTNPKNLGAVINSPYDEGSPYIHPDKKTLYFMSNGHPGMGGYDLFLARQDSSQFWSDLQNLGYPINTRSDEGAIFVDILGERGYFARDTEDPHNQRGNDIYYFDLPKNIRPTPMTFMKISVVDKMTEDLLEAKYQIIRASSMEEVESGASTDGYFLTSLSLNENYLVNIHLDNYAFYSTNYLLGELNSGFDPHLDTAFMTPLASGDSIFSNPIVLANIFFETGSSILKDESSFELQNLFNFLQENPSVSIKLQGHTDNVGQPEDNLDLSVRRAKSVYDFLLENEIDSHRLSYRGFGESDPIADNKTPDGRRKNRRTEFIIFRP